jgi:hypothetical protein
VNWRNHERRLTEALRYIGIRVKDRGGHLVVVREIFDENDNSLGEHTVLSVTELAGAFESIIVERSQVTTD